MCEKSLIQYGQEERYFDKHGCEKGVIIGMKLYIGEQLKALRKEKQITQEALAEVLGVSYQSVSRWELGVSQT